MGARKAKRPVVYLSYARPDRDIARQLAEKLQQAGARPFFDAMSEVGSLWAADVARWLEQADVIVMLISPEWVASDWAQREFAYALRGDRFAGRVVPVMVRPTVGYPWILDQFNLIKLGKSRQASHLADVVHAVTSAARAA